MKLLKAQSVIEATVLAKILGGTEAELGVEGGATFYVPEPGCDTWAVVTVKAFADDSVSLKIGNDEFLIEAKAPKGKGWEKLTKELKKQKGVDNPFTLANWMKNQGYTPGGKKDVKAGKLEEIAKFVAPLGSTPDDAYGRIKTAIAEGASEADVRGLIEEALPSDYTPEDAFHELLEFLDGKRESLSPTTNVSAEKWKMDKKDLGPKSRAPIGTEGSDCGSCTDGKLDKFGICENCGQDMVLSEGLGEIAKGFGANLKAAPGEKRGEQKGATKTVNIVGYSNMSLPRALADKYINGSMTQKDYKAVHVAEEAQKEHIWSEAEWNPSEDAQDDDDDAVQANLKAGDQNTLVSSVMSAVEQALGTTFPEFQGSTTPELVKAKADLTGAVASFAEKLARLSEKSVRV